LIAAQAILPSDEAGRYALGAVATKAAFWLPQAIATVLYPKMASPTASSAAVRQALTMVGAIGALLVAGAAVAGPLVPVLVGRQYASVSGLLWLFAATGAFLALVQCGLLSAIARGRTRVALLAWAGLAADVVGLLALAAWNPEPTVAQAATVAASVAAVTALAVGVACLRLSPAPPAAAEPGGQPLTESVSR
jgi:O-antigen/teichoic acid export membrane protein